MIELRDRTILAVDDDPLVLIGMVAALREQGWRVSTAGNAEAALRRLEDEPGIIAVISDYTMRGLTGVELLNAISQSQPTVALVLVSGRTDLGNSLPSGCQLVAKPFVPEELLSALDAALAHHKP